MSEQALGDPRSPVSGSCLVLRELLRHQRAWYSHSILMPCLLGLGGLGRRASREIGVPSVGQSGDWRSVRMPIRRLAFRPYANQEIGVPSVCQSGDWRSIRMPIGRLAVHQGRGSETICGGHPSPLLPLRTARRPPLPVSSVKGGTETAPPHGKNGSARGMTTSDVSAALIETRLRDSNAERKG